MSFIYTTLASDTFHRANENPLANPPWSTDAGPPANIPCQIINNECVGTSAVVNNDNEGKYTGISWPANQWLQMQVDACTTANCSALLILRRQDFQNGYVFEIDGPLNAASVEMYSLVAGIVSATFFVHNPVNLTAGFTMKFQIFGNQLEAFINGVSQGTGVDNSFASPGVAAIDLFQDVTVDATKVSNFSGGLITQSSGAGSSGSWLTVNADNVLRGVRH